ATGIYYWGPNALGVTSSAAVAVAGARIGVVANDSTTFEVIPTFGGDVQYEHDMVDYAGGHASANHTGGIARLGVGFRFNGRISVIPEIIEPFGHEGATSTFRVTASFNFGR